MITHRKKRKKGNYRGPIKISQWWWWWWWNRNLKQGRSRYCTNYSGRVLLRRTWLTIHSQSYYMVIAPSELHIGDIIRKEKRQCGKPRTYEETMMYKNVWLFFRKEPSHSGSRKRTRTKEREFGAHDSMIQKVTLSYSSRFYDPEWTVNESRNLIRSSRTILWSRRKRKIQNCVWSRCHKRRTAGKTLKPKKGKGKEEENSRETS